MYCVVVMGEGLCVVDVCVELRIGLVLSDVINGLWVVGK